MVRGWNITEGREQLPPLLPGNPNSAASILARDRREDFEIRRDEATRVIYNACSAPVRIFIDGIDDLAEMWLTLAEWLDTASTAIG